jgi:tRNA(fMet)-specific endonuclease VapC
LVAIAPSEIAVSSITWYELFTGVEKCRNPAQERAKLEEFRAAVYEVPFDLAVAIESAQIRADLESRGEMIGPYDVLLAGQVKSLQFTFVTANQREFERIANLKFETW